jgi:hypothetical protein
MKFKKAIMFRYAVHKPDYLFVKVIPYGIDELGR